MGQHRHARLFKNGRNRAVRIPRELDIFGDEVTFFRDGDKLVLEPRNKKMNLLQWLDSRTEGLPPEDRMPEINDYPAEPVTIFDDWKD